MQVAGVRGSARQRTYVRWCRSCRPNRDEPLKRKCQCEHSNCCFQTFVRVRVAEQEYVILDRQIQKIAPSLLVRGQAEIDDLVSNPVSEWKPAAKPLS